MTSAVVVDDHPVVVAGIRAGVAARPALDVVSSGADAYAAWLPPGDGADVVVLDLHLHGGGPAFDLRLLCDAGRHVVVFSTSDADDGVRRRLELGALTYVTKGNGQLHLIAAVRAAAAGRPYTPPCLAAALLTDARRWRPTLASRETEVLLEWFRYESKELVARKLNLSPRTVAG